MRADPEILPAGGTSRSVEARTSAVSFAARLDVCGSALALVDPEGSPVTYRELAAGVAAARELLGTARRLVLVEATHTVETVTTYLAALAGGHPVLLVPPGDADRTAALSARYDPDAVHLAGEVYILDNLNGRVSRDSAYPSYLPIVSFVADKSYIHGFESRRSETAQMPADLGSVMPGEGV